MRGHKKKLLKGICLQDTKKYTVFPRKYRYLERTEGRGDNGQECTEGRGDNGKEYINWGKNWTYINTETGRYECISNPAH